MPLRNQNPLLQSTAHRPWPLPKSSWAFYQEWNQAHFLHWPVKMEALKLLVPRDLSIDCFEGTAWVSVVVFKMERIRPRYLPAFVPISNFDEINIRTYVKGNGKSGVYFLSIEAGKRLSCSIAKSISELPYRYSKMRSTQNTFSALNKSYGDRLSFTAHIGKHAIEKTPLDLWLTERYALFQDNSKGHVNAFEIHHMPWPIYPVQLEKLNLQYRRFSDLLTPQPSLTHYSPGVQVLAWNKTLL